MKEDRIIRINEVIALVSRSRGSIFVDEKAGRFPRRVKIGSRAVGWRYSDIMRWVATRETA